MGRRIAPAFPGQRRICACQVAIVSLISGNRNFTVTAARSSLLTGSDDKASISLSARSHRSRFTKAEACTENGHLIRPKGAPEMLDFNLSPELLDLRQQAREFARKALLPIAWQYDQIDKFPRDIIGKADAAGLANVGIGYEFPNKRGEIFFNVNTFFNRHFPYRLEPIRLEPFFAARQITLRLSRYF